MRGDLPDGTVTFLFTDIEGSTRLLGELGHGYADALSEHRRVVRDACAAHGGAEVDTQGDAFFVAFADAKAALAAAAHAQSALTVPVRMGVHTGEPELTEEGYVGLDVHRAARICAVAHGGQVVVSGRTHACVLEHMATDLRDLGLHRLKDLAEPVRLYQLGGREFPPLRSLNATNLPVQPNALIGREREVDEISRLVRDGARLVTLSGAGGTGKTRLALQAAAELVEDFPDGVFWVPLAALRDSELVLPTIEQTLGARRPLAEHIDEQRLLLLLDNFEQVADCAPELADVLARCPNLHLLVTSRVVLKLHAEVEYAVAPLASGESVQLFRERATVAEPPDAVAEICRRLDGLPLAIELAAARTRALPPERLLERLESRLPLLTGGPRDAPQRQQTLRATIEWSYELLDEGEQHAFARLSVFAGGCALEAAEEVCETDLDTLTTLVEHSLVRQAAGRFSMLETIREFASDRLEASDLDETRSMYGAWVLRLAEEARGGAEGPNQRAWLARLHDEHDNVREVIRLALDEGDSEVVLRIATGLGRFNWLEPAEALTWIERGLDAREDIPQDLLAESLRAAGEAAWFLGDAELALDRFREGLELFRALGDEPSAASMLTRLGPPLDATGRPDEAERVLEQAIALHREFGQDYEHALSLGVLGTLAYENGQLEQGSQLLEAALEHSRQLGDAMLTSNVLINLAEVALERDEVATAVAHTREALEIAWTMGDPITVAFCLATLSTASSASGDVRRAAVLWGATERLDSELGATMWRSDRQSFEERLAPEVLADERGLLEGRELATNEAVALALD